MWHKVFPFCLILISSQTLAEWKTERARYNNTFQNGKDCFSGPLFWTTCRIEESQKIPHNKPFPMVRPKRISFTIIHKSVSVSSHFGHCTQHVYKN